MVFQCTDALVTIATLNIEKLVFFYTHFLEKNPAKYIPNVYAEFQLPGIKLGIFQPKKTEFSEFETSTKSKMSLCLEVNDLESAIAHLTSLGYPPPGEIITAAHGREIYAYDPDNNRIILHHREWVCSEDFSPRIFEDFSPHYEQIITNQAFVPLPA